MLNLPRAWPHRSRRHTDIIEPYLSDVLDQPITARVRRSARRAVREPVLEAYGPDGPVGLVKIGDSERARELVRHEAAVLRILTDRPLKIVAPPTVLHHGVAQGLDVLLLSPLPATSRRVSTELRTAAIAEIAALGGDHELRNAGFQREEARSRTHPAADPRANGRDAAWHGDFTPGNIALGPDGRLLVWNWERFDVGVPFGFDALHHFFHRCLRRMRPRGAARACLAQAGRILEPLWGAQPVVGVPQVGADGEFDLRGQFADCGTAEGPDQLGMSVFDARRIAAYYLIILADRHHRDGHEPLGPPAEWLNPVVDHLECLP